MSWLNNKPTDQPSNPTIPSVKEEVACPNSQILLVQVSSGTTTLEVCLVPPHRFKATPYPQTTILLLGIYPQEMKNDIHKNT